MKREVLYFQHFDYRYTINCTKLIIMNLEYITVKEMGEVYMQVQDHK